MSPSAKMSKILVMILYEKSQILKTVKKERIESLENEAKNPECEKQKYNLTFGTSPHPRALESPPPPALTPTPGKIGTHSAIMFFISKFKKIVGPLRGRGKRGGGNS